MILSPESNVAASGNVGRTCRAHARGPMHADAGRLLHVLSLGLALILSGCIRAGAPEWKWQRCYKGQPRAFADVSILLVARHPVPLRIRSIDGNRVPDATEYHVLPGNHTVVSQLDIPRRFLIEYKEQACTLATEPTGQCTTGAATVELALEPGIVYRMNADLDWQKDGTSRVYWESRGGRWCPRVEAMGSFEALKNALAHQRETFRMWHPEKRGVSEPGDIPWPYVALHTLANPPKHWESLKSKR
jgi:hypothetical protein